MLRGSLAVKVTEGPVFELDVALNEVDSLLKINPNFKLAQLIRGDLLLARARPLSDFGNAPDAAARMEDFRDEARVRLHRSTHHKCSRLGRRLFSCVN